MQSSETELHPIIPLISFMFFVSFVVIAFQSLRFPDSIFFKRSRTHGDLFGKQRRAKKNGLTRPLLERYGNRGY